MWCCEQYSVWCEGDVGEGCMRRGVTSVREHTRRRTQHLVADGDGQRVQLGGEV